VLTTEAGCLWSRAAGKVDIEATRNGLSIRMAAPHAALLHHERSDEIVVFIPLNDLLL
jgi:hypothetical protein